MNPAGLGLAVLALLGLAAASGSRRGGGGGEAAARAALRAPDDVARRPGFVSERDPRGRVILPGVADIQRVGGELEQDVRTPRPAEARRLAGRLSRALRSATPGPVEREDVRAFQLAAGVAPTGLYDAATAAKLRHFGIRNAPPAWFLGAT